MEKRFGHSIADRAAAAAVAHVLLRLARKHPGLPQIFSLPGWGAAEKSACARSQGICAAR